MVGRDLSGYFKDCGCSGGTGGVARFHGVTAGAAEMQVAFVGRSIAPTFNNNQEEGFRLLKLRAHAMLSATAGVWRALGATSWIPDDNELAVLKEANADASALGMYRKQSPAKVGVFEISLNQDYIIVNGTNVQLPRADSRGGEVLVLAWWGKGKALEWKLDRTLGALVSLTRHGAVVTKEINRILSEDAQVWTYWLAPVAPSIQDNQEVALAVEHADIMLSHAPEGVTPVSMPYSATALDSAWARCADCHEQAFNAWTSSRHHGAYRTLTDRRAPSRSSMHYLPRSRVQDFWELD